MLGSVSGPLSIRRPLSTTWPSVLCSGPGPVWRDTWEGPAEVLGERRVLSTVEAPRCKGMWV